MSTIAEVRTRVVDSHLLTDQEADDALSKWRAKGGDDATANGLVQWLIEKELLTEFQGAAILEGHTGPFMLGSYEVREHLAVGTLGGVFRAIHREFDQPVSLKVYPSVLKAAPEKLARVGREVRVLIELDHPNVVSSYDAGKVGDVCYLAMEDLSGETLAARIERDGRLPFHDACRIMRDVAKGLEHLHQNEVIHRDLRPENIWITNEGTPKIMEFGSAHDAFASLDPGADDEVPTTGEIVVGRYDYMAPEQARDACDADQRSDIYALGSVLYHCLTGRPLFLEKDPVKLGMKLAAEAPEPASKLAEGVPMQIDETLDALLAKEPNDRFQTADQVVYALDQHVPPEAEPEQLTVVEASSSYLRWARSRQRKKPATIPEESVAITPELTEFLGWIGAEQSRRGARKKVWW